MNLASIVKTEYAKPGAVLLAVMVFTLISVLPRTRSMSRKRHQIEVMKSSINKRIEEMKELQEIAKDQEAHQDFVIGNEKEILPKLLRVLADKGRKHNVKIISMKPDKMEDLPIAADGGISVRSRKLSIKVRARAGYRSFGQYFESLENIPVLIAVRGLRIVKRDPGSRVLDAEFLIETYALQDDI